jgi:hypothetical protein
LICIEIGGEEIPTIIEIKFSLTTGNSVNSNHFPEGDSWSAEFIYAMHTEQNISKKNLSEAKGQSAINSNIPPTDKTRTPSSLAVDMISNTSGEKIDIKNCKNMSVGDEKESVKNGLNRDTVFGSDLSHLSITSSAETFDQKFKGMKMLITSMDPHVQEAFNKVYMCLYVNMYGHMCIYVCTRRSIHLFLFVLYIYLCTCIFINVNTYIYT